MVTLAVKLPPAAVTAALVERFVPCWVDCHMLRVVTLAVKLPEVTAVVTALVTAAETAVETALVVLELMF